MIKIYIYKLWKDWWFSAIRHWEGRGLIWLNLSRLY
jgi:hypothetical protein